MRIGACVQVYTLKWLKKINKIEPKPAKNNRLLLYSYSKCLFFLLHLEIKKMDGKNQGFIFKFDDS